VEESLLRTLSSTSNKRSNTILDDLRRGARRNERKKDRRHLKDLTSEVEGDEEFRAL